MSSAGRQVHFRVAAVAASAAALGFLAGRDGSPLWQATRVLAVALIAVAAGAAILHLRGPRRRR